MSRQLAYPVSPCHHTLADAGIPIYLRPLSPKRGDAQVFLRPRTPLPHPSTSSQGAPNGEKSRAAQNAPLTITLPPPHHACPQCTHELALPASLLEGHALTIAAALHSTRGVCGAIGFPTPHSSEETQGLSSGNVAAALESSCVLQAPPRASPPWLGKLIPSSWLALPAEVQTCTQFLPHPTWGRKMAP